ncbi:hypothetical protein [Prochlorococcus sp. ALOHA_ZT_50]|jgi:hypothetical protein|uniref:hypothetical protein n=1 Tax=Prochlorococcus sp. ALOHA_ZT_50 TaxID=2919303 RepID=UPI0025804F40|nr:hypothetical protein [Prochlorococcus sp. ALOHA_ZT_50]MCH2079574.1 hypothetical protein [Prochlorococcus sp. ALOHA_ZT_50]
MVLKYLILGRNFNEEGEGVELVASPVIGISAGIEINTIKASVDTIKSSSTVETNDLKASIEIPDIDTKIEESEVLSEL